MSQYSKSRSRVFVNKKFQIRFVIFVLAPVLLSAVVMFVSNYIMYREKLAFGQNLGIPVENGYYALLKFHEAIETQMILVSLAAITLIFVVWALYVSHRIVGPIYRLTETLNNTERGKKIRPIHFRPNDFFQDMATSFNHFIKTHDLDNKD